MIRTVDPSDLLPMDDYTSDYPLRIDLVYADAHHPENIFGKIYRDGARLWLHRDLAAIVLEASGSLRASQGWRLVLKDGLRTVEAQELMQASDAARRNPHWLEEPGRLLSPPGHGAHPRGMAVDLVPETTDGASVDMGTPFDFLSEDPLRNQAARDYTDLPGVVLRNRAALEAAMTDAARKLGIPLFPLPSEWWDFRFPLDIYGRYAPLRDGDLPASLHMTSSLPV